MSNADIQLVEQSRSGDAAAYGQLVERYQGLVRAAAISASGDLAASEEVTQEAFITAWTRLDELREPGRFSSWVCGIARNHARYQRRHDHRHAPGGSEATDDLSSVPALSPSPLDSAIEREERAVVRAALGKIPASYREPLMLFYGQDRSIADVAEHLGVSRDTVKQRLRRGRQHLQHGVRELLRKEFSRPVGTAAAVLLFIANAPSARAAGQVAGTQVAQRAGQHWFSGLPIGTAGAVKVVAIAAIAAALAVYFLARRAPGESAVTDPAPARVESPVTPSPRVATPASTPAMLDAPADFVDPASADMTSAATARPAATALDHRTADTHEGARRTGQAPAQARAVGVPTLTERGPTSVSRPGDGPSVELDEILAPPQTPHQRAVTQPHRLPIPPPDFAERVSDSDY